MRKHLLFPFVSTAAIALAVTACTPQTGNPPADTGAQTGSGAMQGAISSPMNTAYHTATVTLTPSEESGGIVSNGQGTAQLTWNDNESALKYSVSVSGLTGPVTAAHFHAGARGVKGQPVEAILFQGNTASGSWKGLTAQQKADLLAGKIYLNVHTTKYPDGEIRGQVAFGQ